MKIGAITVGQSPRVDVTTDIRPLLGAQVQLIERGALDGLSYEQIGALAPEKGDYVLVSRMKDGRQVTFAERLILPRIQQCIEELEAEGVRMILFFCTGEFPQEFRSRVPLIFPSQILNRLVPLLSGGLPVIVVNPSPTQEKQSQEKWKRYLEQAEFTFASPYGEWQEIEDAAERIKDMKGQLVVLDCIGYSQAMKEYITKATGKLVILSRTLLARTVSELTDIG